MAVRRSSLPIALVAFFAALAIASAFFLAQAYQREIDRGDAIAAMQARAMEGFLTHSLDTLAILARGTGPATDGSVTGGDLLRSIPLVRSLSFVDGDGRIIASTNPRNLGVDVDFAGFYPPGQPAGATLIGPPWIGRDFSSGEPAHPDIGFAGNDLGFVPILFAGPDGGRRALIALNTDYFLTHFVQNVTPGDGHIEVVRYDALMLFSSDAADRAGTIAADVARALRFRTGDFGQLEDDGGRWISHLQASPGQPIAVVARYDRGAALAGWRRTAMTLTATLVASAMIIAGLAFVFMRRHSVIEAQQRTLEHLERVNAASVFSNAREGILIADARGIVTDVNDSFTRLTGVAREEALGRQISHLAVLRPDRGLSRRLLRGLVKRGFWQGEVTYERRGDGECVALARVSTVRDEAGQPQQYVVLFSDITVAKRQARELERAAHYDPLTALPNRSLMSKRLDEAMASAAGAGGPAIAVVFIDIDGFKEINDRYGHAAGDSLLVLMASRLRSALRSHDVLGRIGGDEFVAILGGIADAKDCVGVLQRMLNAAGQPTSIGGEEQRVSASIGVTFYPQAEAVDADQLIRQADQAMYQAKVGGKSRYHVFDAELDRTMREYHAGLERLREALDAREFVLHFQPLVDIGSGRVIELEALIRWQHPEKGLTPPSGFIPLVEGSPFAVDLGEWVIGEALAQLEGWLDAGLDVSVAVNTSGVHLQRADFLDRLEQMFAEVRPEARSRLVIEIPEAAVFSDLDAVARTVVAGHGRGIRFYLDDFGTGYSSLAYLKRLPVDAIKIDRTFVNDMQDRVEAVAVLDAILQIADRLGMETVAEGVETAEQWAALSRLGCDRAQGYFIARPMAAGKVLDWCLGRNAAAAESAVVREVW